MKKTERIAALIASKKNTFTAAHQAFLEAQTDEQLQALQELEASAAEIPAAAAPPAQGTTPQTPATPAVAEAAAPKTEEEYLKDAPQTIRDMVAESKARKAERRTALLAALKGKQDAYSEAELEAMPIDQLERVAKLAKAAAPAPAVDYGALASRETSSSDAPEAAPDLVGAVRAAAGVKQ